MAVTPQLLDRVRRIGLLGDGALVLLWQVFFCVDVVHGRWWAVAGDSVVLALLARMVLDHLERRRTDAPAGDSPPDEPTRCSSQSPSSGSACVLRAGHRIRHAGRRRTVEDDGYDYRERWDTDDELADLLRRNERGLLPPEEASEHLPRLLAELVALRQRIVTVDIDGRPIRYDKLAECEAALDLAEQRTAEAEGEVERLRGAIRQHQSEILAGERISDDVDVDLWRVMGESPDVHLRPAGGP